MSPGMIFERVYHALKEEVGSGRHPAGTQLEPALLSTDLNASITPVRDALHRLVGEGLVEAPRGDGFRTPLVTEIGLRQLYRWHAALVDLAARAPPAAAPAARLALAAAPADREAWLTRTELLFLAIAARTGNDEHLVAVERLGERLRPARRIELVLLAECDEELAELARHGAHGTVRELRRAIGAYHRRRERLAPEIVAALHRPN